MYYDVRYTEFIPGERYFYILLLLLFWKRVYFMADRGHEFVIFMFYSCMAAQSLSEAETNNSLFSPGKVSDQTQSHT